MNEQDRWEAAAANTTDEQLAELPDRVRASIELTRLTEIPYEVCAFTEPGDDAEILIARTDQEDPADELRLPYVVGMDIDEALREHGWTRTSKWRLPLDLPGTSRAAVKRIDKGGRPPIGPRVHVAIPEGTLEQIDQLADANGMTRAEAIRDLLEKAIWGK